MFTNTLTKLYTELSPFEFYREIFPEGALETKGEYVDGKYNAIAVVLGNKIKRYTITDDLKKVDEITKQDEFTILSPISYCGKSRVSKNARFMYALAIDVDGVDEKHFERFIEYFADDNKNKIKKPSYIITSGNGLHIYYRFSKPVALYPEDIPILEELKKTLTEVYWDNWTKYKDDEFQYQTIFQGFRMVGTCTKNGDRVRAFKVGGSYEVAELWENMRPQSEIPQRKKKMPLEKAKKRFPEWHEDKIVNKNTQKKSWVNSINLYEWWKRNIMHQARQGHRFFCLMCLCAYAQKCQVDIKTLRQDAKEFQKKMNELFPLDPLTDKDVKDALKMYKEQYITFPVKSIESLSAIPIPKNKRNGRKRNVHLAVCRAIEQEIYGDEWRKNNGRPKGSSGERERVEQVLKEFPQAKIPEIMERAKVSRSTAYRWKRELK